MRSQISFPVRCPCQSLFTYPVTCSTLASLLSSRVCSSSCSARPGLCHIYRYRRRQPNPNSASISLFWRPAGAMASGSADKKADKKAEKSYLASAVDSINPWSGSRSTTPTPKDRQPAPVPPSTGDHVTNPFYGQTSGRYPSDCPPLKVQWFHAVDVSSAVADTPLYP